MIHAPGVLSRIRFSTRNVYDGCFFKLQQQQQQQQRQHQLPAELQHRRHWQHQRRQPGGNVIKLFLPVIYGFSY